MRLSWLPLMLLACTRAPLLDQPRPSPRPVVGHLDNQPLYTAGDGGLVVVEDGGVVLGRGPTGWRPLASAGQRIDLEDGSYWLALGFNPDGDGPAQLRWVPPAHARAEVEERKRELALEAERLPGALQIRVRPELELMALISTLEGRFADPATRRDDTAASVGIFQWATERRGVHSAGTTLGRFFSTLARRAEEGEPLYNDAWAQCKKLGLRLANGDLWVGKRALSGADLEKLLGAEMGRGALRTYQLIAAADWIDDVKSVVVRPGPRGKSTIGHDYAEAERGRLITLKWEGRTLEVRPIVSYTVGDFFRGAPALATAVSLGVNRPHYVEAALWAARNDLGDARGRVDDLLATIVPPSEKSRFGEHDLHGASLDAYAGLQALLWPAPDGGDEAQLERAFTERALELYRPSDRERRARRLATGK